MSLAETCYELTRGANTHCARGHRLTPENTRVRPHKDGFDRRICLRCEAHRDKQRKETVTCPGCGKTRQRQVKSCYVHADGTCQSCARARAVDLRRQPLPQIEGMEYDALAAWWLDNYSMDEIRELAEGLVGGFTVSSKIGRRASFSDVVGSPSRKVPLAVPPSAVVSEVASNHPYREGDT